jgi:putative DNA primase/helicase
VSVPQDYIGDIEARAEREFQPGAYDGLYRVHGIMPPDQEPPRVAMAPAFELDHVRELLIAPTPIPWLIPGLLARDTLALVSGPPKSLKSFWTDAIANAIGTGAHFDGMPTTSAPVVTICGEGRHGIGRRKRAWEIRYGLSLADAPVYVSKTAARLCEPVAAYEVEQAVQRIADATGEAPGLIVVDTLQRNMGAGDENSTADVSRLILHLDRHLREPFGCCVMVVHHTGHATNERARGSSVLPASVDSAFMVARSGDLVTVSGQFAKDWATPDAMTYRLQIVELPWLGEDGNPETSCVLQRIDAAPVAAQPTGHAARALGVLRDLYAEHRANLASSGHNPGARVTIDDWRDRCDFEHRSQFTRARDWLLNARLIQVAHPHVELTT